MAKTTRKAIPSRKVAPTPPAPASTPSFTGFGKHMKDAYERGTLIALSYKPGDPFLGVLGEADRLGFTEPVTRSLFVTGYLQSLPSPIIMNGDGTIMKIGRVRDPAG